MNRLPIVALFLLPLLGGCVLREFLIQSEPAGAEVFLDGRYIGKTPLKQSFDFYGTHRVVLRKNGYIAYADEIHLRVPWWQHFPLNLIAEVLIPFEIADRQRFHLKLQKAEEIPEHPEEGEERAKDEQQSNNSK